MLIDRYDDWQVMVISPELDDSQQRALAAVRALRERGTLCSRSEYLDAYMAQAVAHGDDEPAEAIAWQALRDLCQAKWHVRLMRRRWHGTGSKRRQVTDAELLSRLEAANAPT